MYEEYFGMSKTPFVRNIPADLLYESSSMKDGLGRLKYAADRQLFAVVCSPAGCGKSTLLRKFNDTLSKDKYLVLYISDSKLTPKWLYRSLLDQLGIESSFYRGDSKRLLQKQIEIIREKEKRKVVCILDEAHLLEKETLEEFRFLLNSNYDSESQMCLILAGQTELWENKLRFKRYAAITQRIDINISLSPLSRAECAEYIDTHMKYAGCNTPIFTDKAIDEIYKTSGGIERVVNKVCDKSLMYAAQQNLRLIDDYVINTIREHETIMIETEMESYIPFETILNEDGYSYHLIYGKHLYGYYLVIPDWNIGCEMSHYNDVFWNKESLIKAGLSVKEASIISVRLKEMIERKN